MPRRSTALGRRCNVVSLPIAPTRSCHTCKSFALVSDDQGLLAARCTAWGEPLDDLTPALDCEDYERTAP